MKAKFKKSSKVYWMWLGNPIQGTVQEVYFERVTKEIKGKKITRIGSPEKPAYMVKSEAGNLALKLETELNKAEKSNAGPKKPTMF